MADANLTPIDSELDRLPKVGDVILSQRAHGQYKLVEKLGSGGYGVVFKATNDENKRFAIKVEQFSKSTLFIEATVLIAAKRSNCTRILDLVEFGHSKPNYYFLVMPLLGKDLASLRNQQQLRCFSCTTATRVGILTLKAIQELHTIGYISRDVKPGNFGIGLSPNEHRIFLLDFGLARKFLDAENNIIPPRKGVGWRGTTRYGSLQAHNKQDLSRKDDVESWFYALVEYTKGSVPWRAKTNREMVHVAKISARLEGRDLFLNGCPKEYDEVLTVIDKLVFTDVPPYEKICSLLEKVMIKNGCSWEQRYDWEERSVCSGTSSITEDANVDEENKTSKTAIQMQD